MSGFDIQSPAPSNYRLNNNNNNNNVDRNLLPTYFKVFEGVSEHFNSISSSLMENFQSTMSIYKSLDDQYKHELAGIDELEKRAPLLRASHENNKKRIAFLKEYNETIKELDKTRKDQENINESRIDYAREKKRKFSEIVPNRQELEYHYHAQNERTREEEEEELMSQQQRKKFRVKQEAAAKNSRKGNL